MVTSNAIVHSPPGQRFFGLGHKGYLSFNLANVMGL